MKKGKTTSGFEFEIDESVFDNWELLEKLYKIDNGNEGLIVGVAEDIFTPEQFADLKAHVKNTDGRTSITGMVREISEILSGVEKN